MCGDVIEKEIEPDVNKQKWQSKQDNKQSHPVVYLEGCIWALFHDSSHTASFVAEFLPALLFCFCFRGCPGILNVSFVEDSLVFPFSSFQHQVMKSPVVGRNQRSFLSQSVGQSGDECGWESYMAKERLGSANHTQVYKNGVWEPEGYFVPCSDPHLFLNTISSWNVIFWKSGTVPNHTMLTYDANMYLLCLKIKTFTTKEPEQKLLKMCQSQHYNSLRANNAVQQKVISSLLGKTELISPRAKLSSCLKIDLHETTKHSQFFSTWENILIVFTLWAERNYEYDLYLWERMACHTFRHVCRVCREYGTRGIWRGTFLILSGGFIAGAVPRQTEEIEIQTKSLNLSSAACPYVWVKRVQFMWGEFKGNQRFSSKFFFWKDGQHHFLQQLCCIISLCSFTEIAFVQSFFLLGKQKQRTELGFECHFRILLHPLLASSTQVQPTRQVWSSVVLRINPSAKCCACPFGQCFVSEKGNSEPSKQKQACGVLPVFIFCYVPNAALVLLSSAAETKMPRKPFDIRQFKHQTLVAT